MEPLTYFVQLQPQRSLGRQLIRSFQVRPEQLIDSTVCKHALAVVS